MVKSIDSRNKPKGKFLKQKGTIMKLVWTSLKMMNERGFYQWIQLQRTLRRFLWKLMMRMTSDKLSKLRKHYQNWIPSLGILLILGSRQIIIDERSRTNMRHWIYPMRLKSLRLQRNSRANIQTQLWDEGEQNPEARISILTLSKILRFWIILRCAGPQLRRSIGAHFQRCTDS